MAEDGGNILFTAFTERPKHLDPARSYSANEAPFTGQVYEPPLQYRYLARLYKLILLTAASLPKVRYLDAQGRALSDDAEPSASHCVDGTG